MTAPGNEEVVALLEQYLEEAKLGQINYVGLFACQKPDRVACDFAGAMEMECVTPAGIEGIRAKIGQSIKDRQPPARDLALGADYVCYRIYQQPANFDFVSWLVQREQERVREGAPAPLRVSFWSPPGLQYQRKMLDPVLRAMVPLLGAIEDDAAKHGRLAPLDAGYSNIVAAARAGEAVPKFRAPAAVRQEVSECKGADQRIRDALHGVAHAGHPFGALRAGQVQLLRRERPNQSGAVQRRAMAGVHQRKR